MNLQTKQVEVLCDKHGPSIVTLYKVFHDWPEAACKACTDENRDKSEAKQAEYREQQEREHRKQEVDGILQRSGIPLRFQNRTFENFITDGKAASSIASICMQYAAGFAEHLKTGKSLIFCGHAGTGKTHLACAIADSIMRQHRKRVSFTTASKAIRSVKETYSRDSKKSEAEAIAAFRRPDLLIIDEVGVQFGSETERYILFEIINDRYESMKPTILLSNLAIDGLTQFAGERVIDRMKENGGKLLIFDWKSHRGVTA